MTSKLLLLIASLLLATQALAFQTPAPAPLTTAGPPPAAVPNACRTPPMQACNACAATCRPDHTPVCKPAKEKCRDGKCKCTRQPVCACQPPAAAATDKP